MKTLIRWLANLTGVTQQIRKERAKEIANSLYEASSWMGGGVTVSEKSPESRDTLQFIAEEMWNPDFGNFNIERVRDRVYKKIRERRMALTQQQIDKGKADGEESQIT